MKKAEIEQPINSGLDGIVVAATRISHVDGERGILIYAGYRLEELIERNCSYEDVVYLLLKNKLPSADESRQFKANLASRRTLSPELASEIDSLSLRMDYMEALRSGMSLLASEIDTSYPPTEDQALDCIAKAPMIISRYYRRKTGQDILPNRSDLSHTENYLYMLTGNTTKKGRAYAKALDVYFITTIEHGMNASTFAVRVAASTESDMLSSIVAGICALKGPLHGGAPLEVIRMLDAIGTKENAEAWILDKLAKKEPIMGFGHRVYKTYDPRATILRRVLESLPQDDGNRYLELSRHVQEVAVRLLNEHKPGRNLYPNVEFGAAGVLRAIGLPEVLYPATFALARMGGWVANYFEQVMNNRLIRPASRYIGNWPEVSVQMAISKRLLLWKEEESKTSSDALTSSLTT